MKVAAVKDKAKQENSCTFIERNQGPEMSLFITNISSEANEGKMLGDTGKVGSVN